MCNKTRANFLLKYNKGFQVQGLCPLTPTSGSALGPRWGPCSQTPVRGLPWCPLTWNPSYACVWCVYRMSCHRWTCRGVNKTTNRKAIAKAKDYQHVQGQASPTP